MNIEITSRGAFGSALVNLDPGDEFRSDSGAMFRASSNIDIDVTTKSAKGDGLFAGLKAGVKRLLARESFFQSTYRITDGNAGEVGLAPTHQGEVKILEIDPSTTWMCAGGSYLGSSAGIETDAKFQGMKGMFSGESLFFLEVKGSGQLLVAAFGRITEVEVDGALTVDTGHVVAFEQSMDYSISKAGSSWIQSFIAGEGLVMNFTGRGKILVQSHNATEFGKWLGPRLPMRD